MPLVKMLLRQTAKELAGCFYGGSDVLSTGDVGRSMRFRKEIGMTESEFVNENWMSFVKPAKELLAHMLNQPGTPQHEKDQIYDALLESRGAMTDDQLVAPSIIRMN